MKKFFTLIAAAMLAVGAYAQTTYDLSGLSYDDLQYNDSDFTYDSTNVCLTYTKGDKVNWSTIQVKDKPIAFAYKNSSTKKTKIFYVKDTYLQTGGKGFRLIISGLTSGQEFEIEVASKGGTAAVFAPVDGCTAAEDNPTLSEKQGENLTYVTLKYTATAETATILESDAGFAINKVTIAAKPEQPATPDDPATGINTVKTEKVNADDPLYNVAGQRVDKNYKGVVIKNGRKYIVK